MDTPISVEVDEIAGPAKMPASNVIDLEGSDDTATEVKDRFALNRPIYKIYGPDVPAGKPFEKSTRPVGSNADCPSHAWPLYNEFKLIDKKDKTSWPPACVHLQDWHVFQILIAGITIEDCVSRWPADFSRTKMILGPRKPRGRAAKKLAGNKIWYYIVLKNGYQLSGDEGAQAIVYVPPITGRSTEKAKRDEYTLGHDCEIQAEFEPTLDELNEGTLLTRLEGRDPRPLNNRQNWGFADRGIDPGDKKIVKKNAEASTSGSSNRKRSAENSTITTSRKATKTSSPISRAPSDELRKTTSRASSSAQASGSGSDFKGKGKERRVDMPSENSNNFIIVRAGLFGKATPMAERVLTAPALGDHQKSQLQSLAQCMEDIKSACVADNREIAISRLLAVETQLGWLIDSNKAFFDKAIDEVKAKKVGEMNGGHPGSSENQ